MGKCETPHYADVYQQLVEDANTICDQIHRQLKQKHGAFTGMSYEESLNTRAGLLITALVGDFFCRSYSKNRLGDFVTQAHALIPRLTNRQLLCYILVLLFYYDEIPAYGVKSQIASMMKLTKGKDRTPEDKHVARLFRSKLEMLRYSNKEG